MSEYLDKDGYPTDEVLDKIKNWPAEDIDDLLPFVKSLWHFPDWGWSQEGNKYCVSTGGWSGNEDLIEAMMKNTVFWMMYWSSSRRGGHYIFQNINDFVQEELSDEISR